MNVAESYRKVLEDVKESAKAAGRDPDSVKLVAVTKTHPPKTIRQAINAGAYVLGENKVQEGLPKIAEIGHDNVEWHLIGHLQKNKVRKAVRDFDVIQTVDSLKLAQRIARIAQEEGRENLRILAQVDLAGESSKFGISESDLPAVTEYLSNCRNLRFEGLMIIPPYFENANDVRPYFQRLRKIRDGLRISGVFPPDGGELSMGMSHDFRIAIEEGATMVRIGTAIFGERNIAAY